MSVEGMSLDDVAMEGGVIIREQPEPQVTFTRQPLRQMQEGNVRSAPTLTRTENQSLGLASQLQLPQQGHTHTRPSPLRGDSSSSENRPPARESPGRRNGSPRARHGHVWHSWQSQLHRAASSDGGQSTLTPPDYIVQEKRAEVTSKELRKLSWIQPEPSQPTARRLFSSPHVRSSPNMSRSSSAKSQQRLAFHGAGTPFSSAPTSRDNSTEFTEAPSLSGSAADSSDVAFSLESSPTSSTSSRRQRRIMIQLDSPDRMPRSPPLHTSSPTAAAARRQRRLLVQVDSPEKTPRSPPMLRRDQLLDALTSDCMQTDL
eukprot:m.456659 g.456659  ORF g.456659 m.456659 type:complete len:316 (-) comp21100_c0_seq1:176-1123(-)